MARKKTLKDFSQDELLSEVAVRFAEDLYRPGITMSEMELAIWEAYGMENAHAERALKTLLARMPLEKTTAKLCPKCGKRTPVKAKDRDRKLRTLAGYLVLKRNYHYCERCQQGFYPLDRTLGIPEEGELTSEMEKRALDFAVNDVFGQGAERWNLHYRIPLSDNLLRRVALRVGNQCQASDPGHLQEALKPASPHAEVLVVEADGSMLPIRGDGSWKEAKVGLTYRHDPLRNKPIPGSARYAAVIGTVANFAPVFEELLIAERIEDVPTVIWLADGAPHNWNLADLLASDAIQILDWFHAVQHAVDCGKALLGEESPFLPLWQQRAETLLAEGDVDAFVHELMDCLPEIHPRRKLGAVPLKAVDDLVRYYRNNAHRMRYKTFREYGFPIGSGAAESAHRHVLQCRMKRAGQRWEIRNARRMAHLRAAYRTAGAARFHSAIQRAHADTLRKRPPPPGTRHPFRFARYGDRDPSRAREAASI